MFSKKKKLQGIELINYMNGRFLTIIGELDTGVEECRSEQADIRTKIELLNDRNDVLTESVARANRFIKSLGTLIGEQKQNGDERN